MNAAKKRGDQSFDTYTKETIRSKDQGAMVMARIYPRGQPGRHDDQFAEISAEVGPQRMQHARFVLRHAPDLVDNVIVGTKPLSKARAEARERKLSARLTLPGIDHSRSVQQPHSDGGGATRRAGGVLRAGRGRAGGARRSPNALDDLLSSNMTQDGADPLRGLRVVDVETVTERLAE